MVLFNYLYDFLQLMLEQLRGTEDTLGGWNITYKWYTGNTAKDYAPDWDSQNYRKKFLVDIHFNNKLL